MWTQRVPAVSLMFVVCLFAAGTVPVRAEEAPPASKAHLETLLAMSIEELMEVEVTIATRSPKAVRKAPALATVVTAEQIRAMGAQTLLDVVRRVPGFSVSINNIGNKVIDVRGLKSYHGEKVLLMVDNHRVNESHSGGAAWSFTDITLDNVERVEIIRGPGSALYGENAFAGVINVITRHARPEGAVGEEGHQNGRTGFVALGGGTEQTGKASVLVGARGEEWAISGFGRVYETDGFSLDVEQDILSLDPITAPFSAAPGETDDWQDLKDLDFWLAWKDFSLHTRYLNKKRGPYINITDALGPGSHRELEHLFAELQWKRKVTDTVDVQATLSFDHHEFDNYWVGYPPGFLGMPGFSEDGLIGEPAGKFRTYGIEVISHVDTFAAHRVTVGAGFRKHHQFDIRYWANFDTTSSIPPPIPLPGGLQEVTEGGNWASEPDHKEEDWSIYGQDDWAINDRVSLVAGIRFDDYHQFGGVFNPRLGLIWEVYPQTILKLLYGRAFRAPSYVERFTINNPAYIGTPDLDPETVDTVEWALSGQWLGISLDAGIYYSAFRDLIVLGEKPSATEPAPYVNRDEATAKGFEITLRRQFGPAVLATANYSYQSLKNDETDETFPGVPAHQGNLEVQWEAFRKVFLNTHVYWCSKRERGEGDPRDALDGYEVVDLALLARDVGANGLDLQVAVNNLLDETYFDPAPVYTIWNDFPRPGIHAMAELRYSF